MSLWIVATASAPELENSITLLKKVFKRRATSVPRLEWRSRLTYNVIHLIIIFMLVHDQEQKEQVVLKSQ